MSSDKQETDRTILKRFIYQEKNKEKDVFFFPRL